jgi:hypothetical protein
MQTRSLVSLVNLYGLISSEPTFGSQSPA